MGRGDKSIFIVFVLSVILLFVSLLSLVDEAKRITGYPIEGALEFEAVGPKTFNIDLILIGVLIVLVISAVIVIIRFFKIITSRREAEEEAEESVITYKESPIVAPVIPAAPAPQAARAKPPAYMPKPKEVMTPEKVEKILRKMEEERGRTLEKRETEELFKKLREIAKS